MQIPRPRRDQLRETGWALLAAGLTLLAGVGVLHILFVLRVW